MQAVTRAYDPVYTDKQELETSGELSCSAVCGLSDVKSSDDAQSLTCCAYRVPARIRSGEFSLCGDLD